MAIKKIITILCLALSILLVMPLSSTASAICGNGICEETEGDWVIKGQTNSMPPNYIYGLRCESDCACAKVGEEGDVFGKKCCSGLIPVPINVEPINGACLEIYPPYGTQFLCIKCGDSICGAKENKCNCPEDCGEPQTLSVCGNGICEEREADISILCADPEGCPFPSIAGTCPQDCKRKAIELKTQLSIVQKKENDETKLTVELSNGKKSQIKIMPEVASGIAIERLRLKVCSAENNCTIELKEVGAGETTKPVYEVDSEKEYRILWLFKIKANVKAEIDAENGNVISIKKPWWSFLAW